MHASRRHALTIALAHTVPGTVVEATWSDGTTTEVGCHAGAAVSPCELRQRWIHPCTAAAIGRSLREVTIVGGIETLRGGRYLRPADPLTHWLVTTLDTDGAVSALESLPDEGANATVMPDPNLGCCVVAITADDPTLLDHLSTAACAALMVAELLVDTARRIAP
jgi:hypothetical protein